MRASARAAASCSASSAPAATVTVPRTLPLTCTGTSTVVVDEQRGIGLRERLERERSSCAEPLPQLLGDVRRERREHQHQRPHHLVGRAPRSLHDLREVVVELEQRARSRC